MKKGISLVALVITIIVLIILTAAVVLTATNTNIFDKANEAKEAKNREEAYDAVQVEVLNVQTQMNGQGISSEFATTLQNNLRAKYPNANASATYENGKVTINYTLGGKEYTLELNSNMGLTMVTPEPDGGANPGGANPGGDEPGGDEPTPPVVQNIFTSGTIPAFTLNDIVSDRDRSGATFTFIDHGEEATTDQARIKSAYGEKAIEISYSSEYGIIDMPYLEYENSYEYIYCFTVNALNLDEGWYTADEETGEFLPLTSANYPVFTGFVIDENTWDSAEYIASNVSTLNTYYGDIFVPVE